MEGAVLTGCPVLKDELLIHRFLNQFHIAVCVEALVADYLSWIVEKCLEEGL